jgi:hypothetical protein
MNAKTCFIGDSHVAALRQALSLQSCEHFGKRMDIFGSRGDSLRNSLEVSKGRMTSQNKRVRKSFRLTGGRVFIDLSAYDRFCLVGFNTGIDFAVRLAETYSPQIFALPDRQPVSRAFFIEMMAAYLQGTIASEILDLLRLHTDKPLYLITNPNMSDAILDHASGKIYAELADIGNMEALHECYVEALERVFANRATILPQPRQTLAKTLLTLKDHSSDSRRLTQKSAEHPEDDFKHMNARFGALVLEDFFSALDSAR